MIIYEEINIFKGIKLVYVGDGNNVCYLLLLVSVKVGMYMIVVMFVGYELNEEIVKKVLVIVKEIGVEIEVLYDFELVVNEVDFIYIDVWMSMG